MPCAHLAVCTQAWADQCWFEHSQYAYGENVAVGQVSLVAAIDAWYREVRVSIKGHREVVYAAKGLGLHALCANGCGLPWQHLLRTPPLPNGRRCAYMTSTTPTSLS